MALLQNHQQHINKQASHLQHLQLKFTKKSCAKHKINHKMYQMIVKCFFSEAFKDTLKALDDFKNKQKSV